MSTEPRAPLAGLTVCMVVTNDVSRDARVRKEADTVATAGARAVVIGVGTKHRQPASFELRLVDPMTPSEHPIRLVRIAQNLLRREAFERRLASAVRDVGADIVHCNDLDTLRAGFAGAGHAPVVFDAHELSTEGGAIRPWERRLAEFRERMLAPRCAAVITVNKPIAEWLQEHRRLSDLPVVVMNGPVRCMESASPQHAPLRLLFQGQFFNDRNIEAAIRVMPHLVGRAVLSLQGWGESERALRQLVDDLGLGDAVRFLPPSDPDDVVAAASQHDDGLIVHKPINLNHRFSAPNKLFDYLGAGLALVVPDLPVLAGVARDYDCGLVFSHVGAPDLQEVLEHLVRDPGEVARLKSGSIRACAEYGWQAQSERLLAVYERVSARLPGDRRA